MRQAECLRNGGLVWPLNLAGASHRTCRLPQLPALQQRLRAKATAADNRVDYFYSSLKANGVFLPALCAQFACPPVRWLLGDADVPLQAPTNPSQCRLDVAQDQLARRPHAFGPLMPAALHGVAWSSMQLGWLGSWVGLEAPWRDTSQAAMLGTLGLSAQALALLAILVQLTLVGLTACLGLLPAFALSLIQLLRGPGNDAAPEVPRCFELRTRMLVRNSLRDHPQIQPLLAQDDGFTSALRQLKVSCPPAYVNHKHATFYDQACQRTLWRAQRQAAATTLYATPAAKQRRDGKTFFVEGEAGIANASFVAARHSSYLAGSGCRYPDRCRSSGPGIPALILGLFAEHPLPSPTRRISHGHLARIALENIDTQVYESIAALAQPHDPSEVRGAIKHGMDLGWYTQMCCLISQQLPAGIISPAAHQHVDRAVASGLVAVALHNQLYIGNMGTCRATLYSFGAFGGVSWKRLSVDHVRGAAEQVPGLASDDAHPLLHEAGLGRGLVFAGAMQMDKAYRARRAEVSVHNLHSVWQHQTLVMASHAVGEVLPSQAVAACLAQLGTAATDKQRAQAILQAAIATGKVHDIRLIVWSPPSRFKQVKQAATQLRRWLSGLPPQDEMR